MANEVAVIEKNWVALADQVKDLPVPFEQEIFLEECHVAGTMHVDDILIKTKDVAVGTVLVLKRDPQNEHTCRTSTTAYWRASWTPGSS